MESVELRVRSQLEASRSLLAETFEDAGAPAVGFAAPGRSEIAGNHTDHEGGSVIACAIDCALAGVAAPNARGEIRVASEGFAPFTLDLERLEPRERELGTSAALVRGMACQLEARGFAPSGVDIALTSTIPSGGGLSSSAAFELAMGRVLEALWERRAGSPQGPIYPTQLALMAKEAENRWFGKPCGLMDQLAIALGGISLMDFEDPDEPKTSSIDLSFEDLGFDLVLVKVGASHDDLTHEYAAVPQEMQAVARAFGKERLSDVAQEEVLAKLGELRASLGDRAVLRALHFFVEDDLVLRRWQALLEEDMDRFCTLTNRSGASSAMFLQNVSVAGSADQAAMVALALATLELGEAGACRIHGGGFGGTIQAFSPVEATQALCRRMDEELGQPSASVYHVVPEGACAWRLA